MRADPHIDLQVAGAQRSAPSPVHVGIKALMRANFPSDTARLHWLAVDIAVASRGDVWGQTLFARACRRRAAMAALPAVYRELHEQHGHAQIYAVFHQARLSGTSDNKGESDAS